MKNFFKYIKYQFITIYLYNFNKFPIFLPFMTKNNVIFCGYTIISEEAAEQLFIAIQKGLEDLAKFFGQLTRFMNKNELRIFLGRFYELITRMPPGQNSGVVPTENDDQLLDLHAILLTNIKQIIYKKSPRKKKKSSKMKINLFKKKL